jgi:NADH-quinone oxidoreductase subunit J
VSVLAASTAAGTAELIAFIVLAPVSVLTALGMVFNRNAIYAALLLVGNFFCLAVFYLLLQAQFMAAVQVIVYAGAIMILFLFVLMLLGVRREDQLSGQLRVQGTVAFVLGAVLLAGILAAVGSGALPDGASALARANQGGNVEALGRLLFTRYTMAFEATGVLLLVAGVGALVLARRVSPRDGGEDEAEVRRPPRPKPATGEPETAEREPVAAAVSAGAAAAPPAAAAAEPVAAEPAAPPAADPAAAADPGDDGHAPGAPGGAPERRTA